MTRVVFGGGRVFDGTTALPTTDVVVEAGRIVDVGPRLDGDERVDLAGRTLLPGLFDCHVHLAFGPADLDLLVSLQRPFSYHFYSAIANMRATLEAGITTVRDAGYLDLGMKQAIDDGLVAGPHTQISVNQISQTGGHGDGWMISGYDLGDLAYPGFPTGMVDGPDAMRLRVRELIRAGADVIKVFTTGGVLSPRDDPRHAHFSDAELAVLVEEATRAGRYVMSHAQGAPGIKAAVRAGIRSIEHGIYLDDEAIEMMLRSGTWLVPTLVAARGVLEAADAGANLLEAQIRKARAVVEVHQDAFRRAVKAGVKIAMGTDSGVTAHGSNLKELVLMEAGGMTPLDVLLATTRSAAELMGLVDEAGSVETGKRADLVVVDGDPFAFADLKQRIRAVYKSGTLVAGAA
ncbi:MAG TPA: amidohydrolase family protein [Candidatus Sulfotelmatobacter sp.]|nr:amidohydrolase family protein [Candidatus Sulfotelmatobacter sp.]